MFRQCSCCSSSHKQENASVNSKNGICILQGGCFFTDPVPRECPQMTTRLFPTRALTQWYMQRASVVRPGSVGSPVESPNPVRVLRSATHTITTNSHQVVVISKESSATFKVQALTFDRITTKKSSSVTIIRQLYSINSILQSRRYALVLVTT